MDVVGDFVHSVYNLNKIMAQSSKKNCSFSEQVKIDIHMFFKHLTCFVMKKKNKSKYLSMKMEKICIIQPMGFMFKNM